MFVLNREIMRKLFSRSIAKIVTILSLTSLVQAAEFHLPLGTPGLQKRNIGGVRQADYKQKPVNTVNENCEKVECVIGVNGSHPNDPLYLYFPTNGKQPTTDEAGEYSGARYNGPNNDAVTDWWVRVFGGDRAVELSNKRPVPIADHAIQMGFNKVNNFVHIVQVDPDDAPTSFEQDFWKAFRKIAKNPVGRILLYRLLIEVRRVNIDENGRKVGCCEVGISTPRGRNDLRNIKIKYSDTGFSFKSSRGYIAFDPQDTETNTMIFNQESNEVATAKDAIPDTLDIGLFHEMLHWFHFLQHLRRYDKSNSKDPAEYRYLLRSYYGDLSELYTWGSIDDEELRTILGSPNYSKPGHRDLMHRNAFIQGGIIPVVDRFTLPANASFLNGDDLSENAYRASRGQRMRFGHENRSIDSVTMHPIPNRFQLAHQVAATCYTQITGNAPQNWDLTQGEAIQP